MTEFPPSASADDDLDHAHLLTAWRVIADACPDIMLLLDLSGRVVGCNRPVPGMSLEEMLEPSLVTHVLPVTRAGLREWIAEVSIASTSRPIEYGVTLPRGGRHWFRAYMMPLRAGHELIALQLLLRDITTQRQEFAELRQLQEQYRMMVEHAAEAILLVDVQNFRLIEANPSACRLFGMPRETLLRTLPHMLRTFRRPEEGSSLLFARECLRQALEGREPVFEYAFRTAAGERIGEARMLRVQSRRGPFVRVGIRDVTEERQLQARARSRQRLTVLGQLAAGIAHDFGNVLVATGGAAELLLHKLDPSHPMHADLQDIRMASDRGRSLLRQLRCFIDPRPPAPARFELNAIVEDTTALLSRVLDSSVLLKLELQARDAHVSVDCWHLEEAIAHLVLSAREAMPRGGTITIATKRIHRAEARPGCNLRGGAVALTVQDSGVRAEGGGREYGSASLVTPSTGSEGEAAELTIVRDFVKASLGCLDVTRSAETMRRVEILFPEAAASIGEEGKGM